MGTMCVEIAHGFFPRARWIFIGHGQHQIDERGNGLGIPGLFLRRDGANAACGIVARHATGRRRTRIIRRGRFPRGALASFLIENLHVLAPHTRDPNHLLIVRRSASARKIGSCEPSWLLLHLKHCYNTTHVRLDRLVCNQEVGGSIPVVSTTVAPLTPVVEVGKGAKFASGEHRVEDSAGFPHISLARSAGFEIADVGSYVLADRCRQVLGGPRFGGRKQPSPHSLALPLQLGHESCITGPIRRPVSIPAAASPFQKPCSVPIPRTSRNSFRRLNAVSGSTASGFAVRRPCATQLRYLRT